jgi:hypothetical protein
MESRRTDMVSLAAAGGLRTCGSCGVMTDDWYLADNNESGFEHVYCGKCEEHRAEKYGCALIIAEGAMCQDGACGCGGTGQY